jgi:hypothetical protein
MDKGRQEEKFVMGTIKKKERGFQDPCSIPIFIRNRLVVRLVAVLVGLIVSVVFKLWGHDM